MPELKIAVQREQILKDPQNGKYRAELIITLANNGLTDECLAEIHRANTELTKTLKLPEYYHAAAIHELSKLMEVSLVECLVRDLELNYDVVDDESLKRVVRRSRRLVERVHGKMFPDKIPPEDWWVSGPHLLGDVRLEMWGAGRIVSLERDEVGLKIYTHGDYGELSVLELCLTIGDMDVHTKDMKVGALVEFGVCTDETLMLRVHTK